jgi:hypothetical protein
LELAETQSAPTSAEQQHDPFPAGTWVTVRQGERKTSVGQVRQRIDEEHLRVHLLSARRRVREAECFYLY